MSVLSALTTLINITFFPIWTLLFRPFKSSSSSTPHTTPSGASNTEQQLQSNVPDTPYIRRVQPETSPVALQTEAYIYTSDNPYEPRPFVRADIFQIASQRLLLKSHSDQLECDSDFVVVIQNPTPPVSPPPAAHAQVVPTPRQEGARTGKRKTTTHRRRTGGKENLVVRQNIKRTTKRTRSSVLGLKASTPWVSPLPVPSPPPPHPSSTVVPSLPCPSSFETSSSVSELPYLRSLASFSSFMSLYIDMPSDDPVSSDATPALKKSDSFALLLASVERRHPGVCWGDIVQFRGDEDDDLSSSSSQSVDGSESSDLEALVEVFEGGAGIVSGGIKTVE
ncbi:hypothetical protein C8J57DRAFT_1712560 [Mycena rebaudengoi]|nr:hypothetical protein C8J57DRAFT_1712560 [Mycena rebaudengoi]